MPVSIPNTAPETSQIDAIEKELGSLSLLDSAREKMLRNELVRLRKLQYSSTFFSPFAIFPAILSARIVAQRVHTTPMSSSPSIHRRPGSEESKMLSNSVFVHDTRIASS
jgi:hypothetical protein